MLFFLLLFYLFPISHQFHIFRVFLSSIYFVIIHLFLIRKSFFVLLKPPFNCSFYSIAIWVECRSCCFLYFLISSAPTIILFKNFYLLSFLLYWTLAFLINFIIIYVLMMHFENNFVLLYYFILILAFISRFCFVLFCRK